MAWGARTTRAEEDLERDLRQVQVGRSKGPEFTGGAHPYRNVGPGDSRVPCRERSNDIHDSGFVFPHPPPAPTRITRAYTYIHSCLGGFVATARQRG